MSGKEMLKNYITDTEGQVFAIHGLEGIIGAVMARYSRAETGLRETLLREFIKEDKLKVNKAYKLIERVLIAYGDDSVGELEGAHLSFENISMLATKVIEHRRIGGSPIEQSTRYIRYDFRNEQTGYHYYTPTDFPTQALEQTYRDSMDRIFENYGKMWAILMPFLEAQKPMDQATYDLGDQGNTFAEMNTPKAQRTFERTYKNDLKTKACDVLRAFLPLATKANVGLFGNGRFFQHLISKMVTSPLAEAKTLGEDAFRELSKIIPHYVKRARHLDYVAENDQRMHDIAEKYFKEMPSVSEEDIALMEPDYIWKTQRLEALGGLNSDNLQRVEAEADHHEFLASLVYSYVRSPLQAIVERIRTLDDAAQEAILATYYGDRKTRRDRPERGIEQGYPYTSDLVTECATHKDLMRHRMATIQIQPMCPDLGFDMPWEIEAAGLKAVAQETVTIAEKLYVKLEAEHPQAREYAVMQGHKVRWLIGLNDRALMHMLELRTAPQGHPNYRTTCQQMHLAAAKRFPKRAAQLNFVNHEDTYWSRSDSEARQRVKEAMLEKDI